MDEIALIQGGGTPTRAEPAFFNGEIPWVTPTDLGPIGQISELGSVKESITELGLQKSSAKLIEPSSVLFSSRASIGKIAVSDKYFTTNQGFANFTPFKDKVDLWFLAFILRRYTKEITALASKTTFLEVPRGKLKAFEIKIPPLAEQRRIVARIKECMERVEEIEALRADIRVESSAISAGARFDAFQISASTVKFDNIIDRGPTNGIYKHANYYGSGTPILRIDNFNGGDILDSRKELKRLQLEDSELERFQLRANDIVINRVNGSLDVVGKACLIPMLKEPTVFESNMMCLSIDKARAIPRYVLHFLASPQCRDQIKSKARVIQQASINQKDVGSFELPLPSLEVQAEIVSNLDAVCSLASQLSLEQKEGDLPASNLGESILRKAFAGEL
ncbi:MAG: restriction endonuclease subunit S [Magnetococcales bacterium]|nr:restriction endonuclease subunit S [Magnetococcales bacterium]